MKFAILGSGAVGGYYGAKLAHAGHDVTFIARGAHLAAIRQRGLRIRSPMLGDFTAHARAESDTATVGLVDVVILAVKAYDNAAALPALVPMLGPASSVVTLQNGVDSVTEVAAVTGQDPVIGGTTYVATALVEPGVVEQTGSHRRIVIGEVFGTLPRLSDRVRALREVLADADIQAEAVDDGRVPIWEKFIFLTSLAGFTGAARLPIGAIREDADCRAQFLEGCREVERLARAEGVPVSGSVIERNRCLHRRYSRVDAFFAADRSVAGKENRSRGAAGGRGASRVAGRRAGADHGDAVCGAEAMGEPTRLRTSSNRLSPLSACSPGSTPMNTDPAAWASTICCRCSMAASCCPSLT
jgi:2-dehydropantoate 2-reductase